MGKSLTIKYKGTQYKLEFNRRAIARMERAGFALEDISRRPVMTIPELFAGAFIMHQPWLKRAVIDEIYENISDRGRLIERLCEMYNQPIESMVDEPEENEGNASWQED